jgi:hypothetical protein
MDLAISIVSFILLIVQILYIRNWTHRRRKYNESGKIEMTDISSITKIGAVTLMLLFVTIYFSLKYLSN